MRYTLSLALISTMTASAAEPTRFIPWSPLHPDVKAGMKERHWKNMGLTDAQVEKTLGDIRNYHTFRERDIVAVYPELRDGRKLSSCSNRIMSGHTSIVFLSNVGDHVVTVKSLSCNPSSGESGVRCGAVKTEQKFFLKSPTEPILLVDVSPNVATTVAQTYQAQRVDGLPDWTAGHFPQLAIIKALPDDHFGLFMGDLACGGCYTRYEVRLDATGEKPRLVFTGNADGGCY